MYLQYPLSINNDQKTNTKIRDTLSFVGEKLTPAVGAECCFSQETYKLQNDN